MNSIEIANILLEAEPGDPDDLSPKDYALSSPGMENLMNQFFGQQNGWFIDNKKTTWVHWNYGLTGKYVGDMLTKFPILADDTPFSFFTVDIFCNQLNKVPVPIHATIRLGGGANKDQRIPPTLPARNLRDLRVLLLKLQQVAQIKFESVDDFYAAVEKLNTDYRHESDDPDDIDPKQFARAALNWTILLQQAGYQPLNQNTTTVWYKEIASQSDIAAERDATMEILVWAYPETVLDRNEGNFSQLAFGIEISKDGETVWGQQSVTLQNLVKTTKTAERVANQWDDAGYRSDEVNESGDPDDIDPKQFALNAFNFNIPGLHLHQDSPVRWHVYANYKMPRQEFMGFVYYDPDPLPPGANPEWDKLRWTASPLQPRKEQKAFTTMEKAIRYLLREKLIESKDPDDINPAEYVASSDLSTAAKLQKAFSEFFTSVRIARAISPIAMTPDRERPVTNWTVVCATKLFSTKLQSYEAEQLVLRWARANGLVTQNFEVNGRLRDAVTFTFETFKSLDESLDDDVDNPENFMRRMLPTISWQKKLYRALHEFHPYGVIYRSEGIGNKYAIVTANTFFPPEKDNFKNRFFELVKNFLSEMGFQGELAMKTGKVHQSGTGMNEWSCFLVLGKELHPPDQIERLENL